MAELKETNIDIVSTQAHATVSSSELKQINKIKKLHEANPEEIEIVIAPEDNYGVIVARMPKSYIKISPPRKVNYTEEQRVAMAERLAAARDKKGD